jgi:hypothetical protein
MHAYGQEQEVDRERLTEVAALETKSIELEATCLWARVSEAGHKLYVN